MSVNADKALQVRPPIAVYVLVATGGNDVFQVPGVPNVIGGAAPEGAHTMITNFLSVQNDSTDPVYIRFSADPSMVVNSADPSLNPWSNNPEPAADGGIAVYPQETVRFDLSDLYEKGTSALKPIEYMGVEAAAGATLRVWRSSGR